MKRLFLLSLFSSFLVSGEFELMFGFVYNAPEDLTIKQDNEEDIHIDNAKMKTKPFKSPPYYGVRYRFSRTAESAYEVEHNHLKLYLDDLPPEVQHFEITDGYNLFWFNKVYFISGLNIRGGAGVVVTHPDITVRDKTNYKEGLGAIPAVYKSGYHLCGVTAQLSVQKEFPITDEVYFSLETKAVYAYADVPIADGSVVVQNRSLHLNYGLGYRF
jgi:acetyltransferase-like isoleucine patch superfamily enzyme